MIDNKKKFKISIIFSLSIALILCGYFVYNEFTRSYLDTADIETDYNVTHEFILQEFMNDEAKANAKYVDKVIEVSGPVFEIDKTNGKVTGVKLSSDQSSIINCTFQEPVEESLLSGNVTIKGVVAGFDYDPDSMIPEPNLQLNRGKVLIK